MMAPPPYPPPGFGPPPPPGFGYYWEPIEYYSEAPEYGYYGEPADYAMAEAPEYGYYGEMEPVGYYAESPELVGWGVGEGPGGMGCTCNKPGPVQGYSEYGGYDGYGRYIPDDPPRSIPNVVAATNLNEHVEESPEYGEAEYGEPEYGEAEYGGAGYGEAEYGVAGYGEPEYGGYTAPAEVSPTCNSFTSPPASGSVPDHFRPLF